MGKLVFESKILILNGWKSKRKIHPNQIFAYRLYVMGMDTKDMYLKELSPSCKNNNLYLCTKINDTDTNYSRKSGRNHY